MCPPNIDQPGVVDQIQGWWLQLAGHEYETELHKSHGLSYYYYRYLIPFKKNWEEVQNRFRIRFLKTSWLYVFQKRDSENKKDCDEQGLVEEKHSSSVALLFQRGLEKLFLCFEYIINKDIHPNKKGENQRRKLKSVQNDAIRFGFRRLTETGLNRRTISHK